MRKQKPSGKERNTQERNMQLIDFPGLRELVIAHKTLLRAKTFGNDTEEQDDDQQLSVFFAG